MLGFNPTEHSWNKKIRWGKSMASQRKELAKQYWRENLKLVSCLLSIWFMVSYGFGILLVEPLNQVSLGGYKLGFWFAQQGSIYIFVLLIFYYAKRMGEIDKKYNVEE